MARKPRIHYSGAYYHVMLRGNGGMHIFHDQDDRNKFLDLVQVSVIRFGYRVHAFCLMTNHVHFAMQVGDVPLSKIIQNISFRYTRYFNKKRKRIGHLFQGRYKALLVDADNYLLQLIRYIHLNPARAKIVMNINDYLWSSHIAYLGLAEVTWLTTQSVFGLLTQNRDSAVDAYQRCMSEQACNSAVDFSLSKQKTFPAICDDHFMQRLMLIQKVDNRMIKISFEKLVKLICDYYEVEESDLRMRSQKRLFSKVRILIARFAIQLKLANLTEVAAYFDRAVATFSRGLSKTAASGDVEFNNIRWYIESAIAQA